MRIVIFIPQFLLALGFYVHSTSCWIITPSKLNVVRRSSRQSTASSSSNIYANKFNVVLEPTIDNPTAFDSLKIGSAKVHRYTRDGGSASQDDEETQYVMWYHGRSVELDETNDKLPPLSTGRIGRATSRNGLVWKKQTSGSQSEDRSDVSLGLNKESWWGFDTTHVGLGTVMLPMSTPAVMTEGGVYLLYYMGGNGEESTLQDFLDAPNSEISEKTIQGMNMRIGVALSQDGITFGRVEGDDPTGAIVVPEKDELYCAWPEVLVNVGDSVPKPDSFIMYYSTMLKSTKQKCIAFATSADGFRWTKQQVCIEPSTDTHYDAAGVARCYVHQDAVYNKGTWIEIPNSYTMYYEGVSSQDTKHRIMKAISTDGKKWTKAGLVLDIGTEDSWDCNGVGAPHIIRLDDGSSRMYYSGQGQNGSTAIGVAKDIDGSGNWVREQATILLSS